MSKKKIIKYYQRHVNSDNTFRIANNSFDIERPRDYIRFSRVVFNISLFSCISIHMYLWNNYYFERQ